MKYGLSDFKASFSNIIYSSTNSFSESCSISNPSSHTFISIASIKPPKCSLFSNCSFMSETLSDTVFPFNSTAHFLLLKNVTNIIIKIPNPHVDRDISSLESCNIVLNKSDSKKSGYVLSTIMIIPSIKNMRLNEERPDTQFSIVCMPKGFTRSSTR